MTSSPPPQNSPPPSGRPLGFDDVIGIVVAFLVIGTIFFWSTSRRDRGFALLDSQTLPLLQSDDSSGAQSDRVDRAEDSEAEAETPDRLSSLGTAVELEPRSDRQPSVILIPSGDANEDRRSSAQSLDARRSEPDEQLEGAIVPVPIDPSSTAPSSTASSTAFPSVQAVEFTDVPSNFWALPFITEMSERGIISGFEDSTFRPDQPITRAEFAAMLRKAFEQSPDERSVPSFSDVPADFWAIPAIQKSYRIGFLEGYPGNIFRPTQQIPRVQALVALATGLGLSESADPSAIVQNYQDANQIPDYATGRIAAATEAGLVVNYPNSQTLAPNQNATRAEVAAFIYQALVESGQVEPIESQYVVQP